MLDSYTKSALFIAATAGAVFTALEVWNKRSGHVRETRIVNPFKAFSSANSGW